MLGGGSNLVVADGGFPGTVVEVATSGVEIDADDGPTCGGAMVTVAAGETWDDLVALAVERGWIGVEALSGIPGSVGATPIQNVGAYGQEVSQTIARVRVWDRTLRGVRTFANADCRFGYRTSRFKADPAPPRRAVGDLPAPPGRPRRPGGVRRARPRPGRRAGRAGAAGRRTREAVLGLRSGKGMVLDPADHDTWSAGSFFTNPVVDAAAVPDGAPAWPQPDGRVKTSAAWLIEHAGFAKGYGAGAVALSGKHTLALTNRGGATTDDLLALAREVRDGVAERFGIRLVNEPVLVGCEL